MSKHGHLPVESAFIKISTLLFILCFALSSCALVEKRRQPTQQPYADYFPLSTEEVSALLSEYILPRYELASESTNTDSFETQWSSKPHPYQHASYALKQQHRSKLRFEVVDISPPTSPTTALRFRTKLTIEKTLEIRRSTIQGWKTIPSDGLEEEALLYRMNRLVQLKKMGKL